MDGRGARFGIFTPYDGIGQYDDFHHGYVPCWVVCLNPRYPSIIELIREGLPSALQLFPQEFVLSPLDTRAPPLWRLGLRTRFFTATLISTSCLSFDIWRAASDLSAPGALTRRKTCAIRATELPAQLNPRSKQRSLAAAGNELGRGGAELQQRSNVGRQLMRGNTGSE